MNKSQEFTNSQVDRYGFLSRSPLINQPEKRLLLGIVGQGFQDLFSNDPNLRHDALHFVMSQDAQDWLDASGVFTVNIREHLINNPLQVLTGKTVGHTKATKFKQRLLEQWECE